MTDYILPDEFPAIWASDWGEDDSGLWMAFTYKGIRQGFRWIQPGSFLMGSPVDEPERREHETQHEVTLTRGFWLAETTCTQALWEAVMGNNPSHFKGAERPVENISWENAQRFMETLNAQQEQLDLRFPTEAEWEYACRAGTQTPFSFGDNITPDQVNYAGERPYAGGVKGLDRAETVDVTALPKNQWGLYQMHGNVWEWCSGWYADYPTEPVTNPQGPAKGVNRLLRGGSWVNDGRRVRSAYRSNLSPSLRFHYFGFRLARGPQARQVRE